MSRELIVAMCALIGPALFIVYVWYLASKSARKQRMLRRLMES